MATLNQILTITLILLSIQATKAEEPSDFIYGSDLSYVNQMEDCGVIYKESGQPKDPFQIFADHGTNLVRVRLWVDPSWWQSPLTQPSGVKKTYNDLEDVTKTIRRAKSAGMKVMLGIHYSDFWADPGRQLIPRRWVAASADLSILEDSVYQYTFNVLAHLASLDLMPDIVKVGNENNMGILNQIPKTDGFDAANTISYDWKRHAQLYNAAIRAIRDISKTTDIKPKIALHFSNPLATQLYNYSNIIDAGVTDFDIIGFSYYYAWHGGSISELEKTIRDLTIKFYTYEVMVVETGYIWSQQNFDRAGNIINTPDPDYYPISPEKQKEYMVDFTRAVMVGGGSGVIFWEPAWVSSPCSTPWSVGSSHDHVAFFEPKTNNFMANGAGTWPTSKLYINPTLEKVTFKVDMTGIDVSNGVYILGTWMDNASPVAMLDEGDNIYSYYDYLTDTRKEGYYFLNGQTTASKELLPASALLWQDSMRYLQVSDSKNEFYYTWQTETNNLTTITFNVDLHGIKRPKDEFVYLHGSFNNWNPIPMQQTSDSIYTLTLPLNKQSSYSYHYSMGPTWKKPIQESIPNNCSQLNSASNRVVVTTDLAETTYDYYSSCKTHVAITDHTIAATTRPTAKGFEISTTSETHIIVSSIDGKELVNDTLVGDRVIDCENGIYIITVIGQGSKKVFVNN